MDGLRKFGDFQANNFGITLVVLFQLIPLVLRGRGSGKSKSNKR